MTNLWLVKPTNWRFRSPVPLTIWLNVTSDEYTQWAKENHSLQLYVFFKDETQTNRTSMNEEGEEFSEMGSSSFVFTDVCQTHLLVFFFRNLIEY